MGNVHRYVHGAIRRFYGRHWMEFCDLIHVSPMQQGAFNGQGDMIGLQLPADADVAAMTKSLRMVYSVTEADVLSRCYLFGGRYYRFTFFDHTIAVSEDDHENVVKHSVQS